jgi:hypothetical protein
MAQLYPVNGATLVRLEEQTDTVLDASKPSLRPNMLQASCHLVYVERAAIKEVVYNYFQSEVQRFLPDDAHNLSVEQWEECVAYAVTHSLASVEGYVALLQTLPASYATPMERFLTWTTADDPFPLYARQAMAEGGVQEGDVRRPRRRIVQRAP